MQSTVEGVDSIRSAKGHGVLLIGQDGLADRPVSYMAPEAPPAPACIAVSNKYGIVVAPSAEGNDTK